MKEYDGRADGKSDDSEKEAPRRGCRRAVPEALGEDLSSTRRRRRKVVSSSDPALEGILGHLCLPKPLPPLYVLAKDKGLM